MSHSIGRPTKSKIVGMPFVISHCPQQVFWVCLYPSSMKMWGYLMLIIKRMLGIEGTIYKASKEKVLTSGLY